ncbi:MAG: TIGR03621 family F420-dependent LLM class oxidoreductase, partial [Actinomycetota bacterium]
MRPFEFGLQFVAMDGPEPVRELARRAEDLGWSEVSTPDHVGLPDPFVSLAVAAEATTTVRIGTLVVNNELHHTGLLARSAATLDAMSGGRFVLGLGTGYQRSEHDAIGVELREPGPRVDRFEGAVLGLRSLLDAGRADLDHGGVSLHVEDLGIRPARRVPLLIGGHGRRVVSIAGRHADTFQFTGLTHADGSGDPTPGGFVWEQLVERRRWLDESAGDRIDEIDVSALVQVVHVGDGADEARAETAERLGVDDEAIDLLPFVLVGTVDQIVEKL